MPWLNQWFRVNLEFQAVQNQDFILACNAGGFWRGEWIYIFPSDVQVPWLPDLFLSQSDGIVVFLVFRRSRREKPLASRVVFRPPSWNRKSGELGRGKKFTKRGREKEKLGSGEGREKKKKEKMKRKFYFSFPAPNPLQHSLILAPILPVCSESRIPAKHSKDHQNRLHCRLISSQSLWQNVENFKDMQWKQLSLLWLLQLHVLLKERRGWISHSHYTENLHTIKF